MVWKYFHPTSRVLELGPKIVPSEYEAQCATHFPEGGQHLPWDTLDIYPKDPKLTYVSDPHSFPIPSNTYDIVFSNQVFKYVPRVWDWIKEQARVCKEGGLVITVETTNRKIRPDLNDYWRVSQDGLKACFEWAGLEVVEAACLNLGGLEADTCEDTCVVGMKPKPQMVGI